MIGHQLPGPAAVIVPAGQARTLLAALDEAAGYKRDRAATCAGCAANPAPPASGGFGPPMPAIRWPPR